MALYSAFADITAPTVANSETIGVNLATEIVCQPGWLMGYRFVRPTTATVGPFTAAFYNTATGTADPATVVNNITPSTTGWIEVLLPAPVYYAAQIRARATIHHPSGRYAFLNNAFASDGTWPAGRTSGPLFVPPSLNTANGNGLFLAGSSIAMPTNMFDETFYYIDVIWSDVDPVGREGTGAITATATLTAAGSKTTTGTGALTAAGMLAPSGRKDGAGTGLIFGAASTASAGRKDGTGNGALAAAATLAATGATQRTGTGTLTATGTLAATGHDPDDAVTAPQFSVGAPHTRWAVGPPRTS